MFKKENNKESELKESIKNKVFEVSNELTKTALNLDENFKDSFYLRCLIDTISYFGFSWRLEGKTVVDLEQTLKDIDTTKEEYLEKIETFAKKSKENIEKLEEWYENGVPPFITLTSVGSGNKMYCMCYGFKKCDEKNKYSVYVFDTLKKNGYVLNFSYFDFYVSKMTKEEFENDYIIGRLNQQTFHYETDAINYINNIRKLFNEQ